MNCHAIILVITIALVGILSFSEDKGFNGKISQCIDKALDSLGEGVKQSFYYQIEERFQLPKDEFASRPEDVIEDLREILGPTGSSSVERLIVKEIRKEFGLDSSDQAALSVVINEARRKFLHIAESSG